MERMIADLIIKEWVLKCGDDDCATRKKLTLKKVVLAKLYGLIKHRNAEFKVSKSTSTTLGQLRNA